jgi:hypothetical protein
MRQSEDRGYSRSPPCFVVLPYYLCVLDPMHVASRLGNIRGKRRAIHS